MANGASSPVRHSPTPYPSLQREGGRKRGALAFTLLPILFAACSFAPRYAVPTTPAPAAYKEAPAGWAEATPLDANPRGEWWRIFNDPTLDALEARIEPASPTLAAALARYDAARAAARQAKADLYPTIDGAVSAERNRFSADRQLSPGTSVTQNNFTLGGTFAYEIDLWGRVRNSVRAARADAQASGADLAATRLSLHTSVADAYFRLRGLDAEAELLRETVRAYTRAEELTDTRHTGGIASGLDVSRARTILSDARAQISDVANQRAATEHEIAALVGEVASSFAVAPVAARQEPPVTPPGAPSTLLQRRPDIAAAERRIAAANSRIGVARAALFPQLTLGGGGGVESTALGSLLTAPATYWALGPAQALLTLFDGGRRAAQVRISRADYDEAAANYRATVLTAFREVEDALAAERTLTTQATDQLDAATAAERTRDLALTRYRDGASDYLEVVTAQTAALDAERALLTVRTLRMRAAVALVRATGGGFGTT